MELQARPALSGVYRFYVLRSGLHEEVIEAHGENQKQTFCIYTGGNKDSTPVLMIHGFGDSRISFGQAAQFLSPHHNLTLPDVPGFGDTPEDPAVHHGISSQVTAMKSLLEAMGIKKVSLVGNSMGGHISAAFTLTHPEMVERLAVLNHAGLRVDDPNPYADVDAPLANNGDFDAYMDKLFFKRPWIPGPFRRDFIAKANARFAWLNRIRGEIRADQDYILNDRISAITVPTLILWGRHDKIISPVHAPVWHEKIKNSRMEIWRETINAEIGLQSEAGEIIGDVILGDLKTHDASIDPRSKDRGFLLRAASYYGGKSQLGVNLLSTTGDFVDRNALGAFAVAGIGERFVYLGEVDFEQKKLVGSPSGRKLNSALISHQRVSFEATRGLHFSANWDSLLPLKSDLHARQWSAGPGIQWFPRPHFEFSVQAAKIYQGAYSDPRGYDLKMMLHLWL